MIKLIISRKEKLQLQYQIERYMKGKITEKLKLTYWSGGPFSVPSRQWKFKNVINKFKNFPLHLRNVFSINQSKNIIIFNNFY